jgi:phasin family protein
MVAAAPRYVFFFHKSQGGENTMQSGRTSESTMLFPLDQFSALLGGMTLPSIDVTGLLASQKKNMEALAEITRLTTEGAGTVARRQAQMIQAALEQNAALVQDLGSPANGKDNVAARLKRTLETNVANARELTQLIERSNKEVCEVIWRRTDRALEEILGLLRASTGH